MPMTAQVRFMLGNNDQMPEAGLDVALATRAGVGLASLVRLDHIHDQWVVVGTTIHQTTPR